MVKTLGSQCSGHGLIPSQVRSQMLHRSAKKKKNFGGQFLKRKKKKSLGDMHIRVVFSGAEIAADIYFLYYVILKCLHFL